MIILKNKYQLNTSAKSIENWLTRKSNEKLNLIKWNKYFIDSSENQFSIRKRRLNNYQAFYPKITGTYLNIQRTELKIVIRPSLMGTIFFSLFWFIFPIGIFTIKEAEINGTMKILDFSDRLEFIGFLLLVLIPLTLFFLIIPNYRAKTWIENELKLNKKL